jgi:malonate decarboxylase alpha subunit
VLPDRITGFGGAPNMGSDPHGRRHASEPWLKAGAEAARASGGTAPGRKLVVQLVETFGEKMTPVFVERLDCHDLAESQGWAVAPVMIRGDDVTHIVTPEGIANLLLCANREEREQAIRAVAGYTEVGRGRDERRVALLRARGAVQYPSDLGIEPLAAQRQLLAARSIRDLVRWSQGLYKPPGKFRNW